MDISKNELIDRLMAVLMEHRTVAAPTVEEFDAAVSQTGEIEDAPPGASPILPTLPEPLSFTFKADCTDIAKLFPAPSHLTVAEVHALVEHARFDAIAKARRLAAEDAVEMLSSQKVVTKREVEALKLEIVNKVLEAVESVRRNKLS